MEENKYNAIVNYVAHNILPGTFTSTQANFIRMCSQFQVNANGVLMRNQKLVVKIQDRDAIFQEMHSILHL